jgi:hypothetical protein
VRAAHCSDVPPSIKHFPPLASMVAPRFYLMVQEKEKVLEFKLQKGALILEEMSHLAVIKRESSTSMPGRGLGPNRDNSLS